jgi:hypothetical protein
MILQSERKNSTQAAGLRILESVILSNNPYSSWNDEALRGQRLHRNPYFQGADVTSLTYFGPSSDYFASETKSDKKNSYGLSHLSALTAWTIWLSSSFESSTEIARDELRADIEVRPEARPFMNKNGLNASIETVLGIVVATITKGALKAIMVRYEENENYDRSIHRILIVDIRIGASVEAVGAWDDAIQRNIVANIQSAHLELFSLNYLFD